jgi:hypothetical protein
MIDTPDDLLLLEAEHLARDLLLDADNTQRAVASLLNGWAPVVRASSGCFAPQTVTPFSQVLEVCRGMRRDARDWIGPGAPDPRLTRIRELFEDVASAPQAARDLPRRQNAVLQTCYLTTHAVAGTISRYGAELRHDESTRPRGLLIAALGSRVQGAEQILDAQLTDRSATIGPAVGPAQALGAAIAGWDRALHDALVDQTPDPRVLLVSANVSLGLLRRTAELASLAVANGDMDSFHVHARLLPTLRPVTDGWERDRDTWRALAPMTTGIPHPVAAAAHALHQALHSPELEPGSDTRHALRLAVLATVEAAHLQAQATRRSDLRGIASGVSALTQAVFDQVPGARSLDLWRQLERLDGPALISIPAPVRSEMLRQAAGTLAAATMAASASHSLVGADVGKVRPTHGVAGPESEAYGRSRIGPRPFSPTGW